jgi:surface protein
MNKKLVAFALSTTALLGAGAMVETTPFAGTAANAAYATTANRMYETSIGTSEVVVYEDGTVEIGAGTFTAEQLRLCVDDVFVMTAKGPSVVFESGATLSDSPEGLFSKHAVASVTGEIVVNGSMKQAFYNCTRLTTIDLALGAGSNVTDLTDAFRGCTALTTVDVSGWDVTGVKSLQSAFASCTALETLDLSGWDVSGVERFCGMFENDSALETLVLTGWDTSSATTFEEMFRKCTALTTIDLSGWKTSNVKIMGRMFFGCTGLTEAKLAGWDLAKMENVAYMFSGCTSLEALDLTGWVLDTNDLANLSGDTTTVTRLTLGSDQGVGVLAGIPSTEKWVKLGNRALGEFTTAELVAGWDNETMAGTWYTASTIPAAAPLPVYRLYNPNSGEHFYTLSEVERDATVAAGWNDEGIGWYAPDDAASPVYRLYSGTDHHYTKDDEGVAFYSADPEDGIALLRQFNPFVDPEAATNNSGSHNYTTDQVENDYLVSLGWQAEDVAFYGMAVEDQAS